jgi:hypothetical protein
MDLPDKDAHESSYNAFGYDPFGKIAHLCHYFFGPKWQPTTQIHLENLRVTRDQPRYGQPAPSQLDQLPKSFTPRPPPLYLGTPSPPYIDGPLVFDSRLFARMASCLSPSKRNTNPSKALCYKRTHGMEVMNGGVCAALACFVDGSLQPFVQYIGSTLN